MKTSRLSTVPTSSSSTSTSSSPSSSSGSGSSTNTVGSRLFTQTKVDNSPLDFENEKELQKKLDDIVSEFRNKDKEWTFRLKALQILQRIINGNGIEFKGWSSMLRSISPALIEQLTELRSTIVKEACASVSLLGFRMKSKFEPFALQYTQALIRMVPVKTTIISESAHQTLKDILESVSTKNLLQTFLDASLDQHNEQLRKRCSEYIYIVLSRAIENDGMILVSSVPALEKSIQKLLIDGASETRQMARYCFWAYSELNEKSATLFYTHFTPTTQKNLFTVQEHLKGDQLEFCEKLKNSLFEEEQHQKMVEDSNDLDFDLNDFKKDNNNNNNNDNNNNNNTSTTRSKTPTTGRASGLKIRSSTNTTPTTTTTTTTTTTPNKTQSSSSTSLRSGSSIGNRTEVSSSIKRPLDASNIIRSKSSLGTTRKDVITGGSGGGGGGGMSTSSQSPISKTPTTMITKTASSSSPNLATSTQSGRYSSIGTRAITTSLSKQSSSSNLTRSLPPIIKSPISPPGPTPPAPTLTKSKSTPSSPLSTPTPSKLSSSTNTTTSTSTTTTSTTPTRRISSSTTSSPIGSTTTSALKRPSTLTSTPKSSSSSSSSSSSATLSSTKTPSTTATNSTTSSATKKSFITKTNPTDEQTTTPKSITKTTTTTTTANSTSTSSIKRRSDNVDEIDIESLEISLNQDNKLAFNEISDEISNNLRDAKKGLSFYEKELTLDDLENNNNNNSNSNSNSNSNNNSKRSSVSSFTNSIKESTTADVDFNWLEDSVHDSLIDDDVLDFDENNNSTYIPRNNNNNNNNNNIIKEQQEQQEGEQQEERQQEQILDEDDELMF
uniref:Uncharacterized protein DDB_G0280205 n=2 Tax=Dictyostelium discoideum TaxID=44689 RepID=Y6442_DICDI|nr:RecName: Full=Uncharacterized protein DDB_G0280205 [Dictyostelium discoideum]